MGKSDFGPKELRYYFVDTPNYIGFDIKDKKKKVILSVIFMHGQALLKDRLGSEIGSIRIPVDTLSEAKVNVLFNRGDGYKDSLDFKARNGRIWELSLNDDTLPKVLLRFSGIPCTIWSVKANREIGQFNCFPNESKEGIIKFNSELKLNSCLAIAFSLGFAHFTRKASACTMNLKNRQTKSPIYIFYGGFTAITMGANAYNSYINGTFIEDGLSLYLETSLELGEMLLTIDGTRGQLVNGTILNGRYVPNGNAQVDSF